jgi:2-polyprenyl-3-methyl-5-hydroxy-6-metoxy-1,4-benzoquinol methylase
MMDYRKRIYDKYASEFQNTNPSFNSKEAFRWGRAYDYYFRHWLPEDMGAGIVDLACGGGKLLFFFNRYNYKNLKGVDISPEQVKLARQVCQDVFETNALDYLASHPGTFDLITGLDIIEHFNKDEVFRFLDGCFAGLKPGGRLILQTPNAESPWGMATRYGDFTHEVCFTPDALTRLFIMSGFNNMETRELGPVPLGYSIKSTIRFVIWQIIRRILMLWNLAETGGSGNGVFTRVFLVSGTK